MIRIKLFASLFLAVLLFGSCSDKQPKATGLPGDNLDLYAVLDLFKSSTSVENFEKSLNDKSSSVNNIDLNGDGKVDYIRVIDQRDGDDHAITLRVPVAKDESQDLAVIEIEKTGDKTASIQIIGDEDMYGKDVIIEPKDGTNQAGFIYASTAVSVNVWMWPTVAYVYSPEYVVWVSPYEYDYYPVYWSPWEPVAYEAYYPVFYKNHDHYVEFGQLRFKHAHEIYYNNRMRSGFVMEREKDGDFHEGKQERYKGNNFPRKENGGNDKHDGDNKNFGNGLGGSHDDKMGGSHDDKKGNAPMGGGNRNDNNQKTQDHSQKMGGGNSPQQSNQKSSAPRGSNQKQGGGGGSHKGGGGGKHH